MSSFKCNKIEYILVNNCESITFDEIVPKNGQDLEELILNNSPEFNEKQKYARGLPYYEQTLQVQLNYEDIDALQKIHNTYLIIKIFPEEKKTICLGIIQTLQSCESLHKSC